MHYHVPNEKLQPHLLVQSKRKETWRSSTRQQGQANDHTWFSKAGITYHVSRLILVLAEIFSTNLQIAIKHVAAELHLKCYANGLNKSEVSIHVAKFAPDQRTDILPNQFYPINETKISV